MITQFKLDQNEEETLIPKNFFESRILIQIELPYCETNEKLSHHFMEKLTKFTNNEYRFMIIWKTRKIQSIFKLKDKNLYPSCVVYRGTCSCGDNYIGETELNTENRWLQHKKPNHNSNPARHIKQHRSHQFAWKVICHSYKNSRKRQNT